MREICLFGSMRGVWRRSHGRATKAPPDERGGNRHAQPKATAPHSYSTEIRGRYRVGGQEKNKPDDANSNCFVADIMMLEREAALKPAR